MILRFSLLATVIAAVGCAGGGHNLPHAAHLMHPGPGVDGPGPGVMMPAPIPPMMAMSSQIEFVGPDGMVVRWDAVEQGGFDSEPLICPGRYNFPQGAVYRMKLTDIPGRPGVELYPTLEVAPTMPRTAAYLSHNAIPVQWTEEDFDQVATGNFVTKVLYLPDAEFQDLAIPGVETLVSTRLDPGIDPIVEADRRGSILAVLRLGNKDLEVPGLEAEMVGGEAGVMPDGYAASLGGVPGQWGMPITGTPIGLPGPPHVPLGIPAGLQQHEIRNHTRTRIPEPTRKFKIDVRQSPGLSYPQPVNHVSVRERTTAN
ncbi:MAG: hypothetical protein R3C10_16040 [Pirellulales bacterium]|nr:hypothetical protein [Planctomycetales bacterium]